MNLYYYIKVVHILKIALVKQGISYYLCTDNKIILIIRW